MVEETHGWPARWWLLPFLSHLSHGYYTLLVPLFSYFHICIFFGDYSEESCFCFQFARNINKTITFSICQGKWKEKWTENSNKELYYEKLTFSFFYFVYMYMHCYFPTLDILKLCGKGYWKAIAMHALPSSRDWFWLKRIFANAV